MRRTLRNGFLLAAVIALLTGMTALAAPAPKTLENLQAAYNGESNAHAKYLEFAKKADAEGYGNVASLFRAAAKAEEIHAGNHAAIIKKLGAEPKADVKPAEVKSTKENLEAAIKGETYEKDTMYPDFIKQAKLDKVSPAVEAFSEAKVAEAGHAQLYTEALNNLDKWKGGKKDFFVCGVCGYTVPKIDFKKCPNCFQPVDKYVKVD